MEDDRYPHLQLYTVGRLAVSANGFIPAGTFLCFVRSTLPREFEEPMTGRGGVALSATCDSTR